MKRRHSQSCLCHQSIKSQTQEYSGLINDLTDDKKRKKILKRCDPCFLRYICKCVNGVLHSAIKLPKESYKQLKGEKKFLVSLVKKKSSILKKRKKLLKHKGSGFWPILSNIASTVLGTLISAVI